MTKAIKRLAVIALCVAVCACSSSDDNGIITDPQNTQLGVVTEFPVAGDIFSDDTTDAVVQCDADFDHAELLFTETDRQWFCSVSSSELASADDVYFSRSGTAVFSRFGLVYWNRNLQANEINLASPSISSFVIRELSASNSTLQFFLDADGEADQQYDCVLVGRANVS